MEDRTVVRAGAPPPPSEVKVRTMQSDLASMAKSGGGMPSFQNVSVDGLSMEKEYVAPVAAAAPAMAATPVTAPVTQSVTTTSATSMAGSFVAPAVTVNQPVATETEPAPKKDFYPILIVIVVAIIAIGAVGYFAYITFFASAATKNSGAPAAQSATLPAVAATTTSNTASTSQTVVTTAPAMELSAVHVSLFIKPADQVITIAFGNTSTTNVATYRKAMNSSLAAANPGSTMIEIDPKASDGNNLSIDGLLSTAGAPILNIQALVAFNPDATFFIYRDKNGLWPGYILALNAGQSSSSVMANVQLLESSTSTANLFLTNPGTASSDGFTDSMINNVPVRILPFSGLSIPLYFTYGWDGNYLILSTSKNGFESAITGLQ